MHYIYSILNHLRANGVMRFKDLQEHARGVFPKVLSKELQELEDNLLITRTVNSTKPITVSYSLIEHALESYSVLESLIEFGQKHRKLIMLNSI